MEQGAASHAQNKEVFLLAALALLAVGVFLFTKRMAESEQRLENRLATIWFEQGQQQIRSGDVEAAIRSFRRATGDERENRNYSLALADALTAGNDNAEAQQLLLRLRESDPENADINTRLARLAAGAGQVADAVHYYQNALYGRWTGTQVDEQRQLLRIELTGFLLAHGQQNRAISELLILEAEPPESARSHIETAKLFVQAGDLQHALDNYSEAARLDSQSVEALTGAGEVAFQLADYPKTVHYLKLAVGMEPQAGKARELLSLAEMVLGQDPLAPHASSEERQRRLTLGFERSLHALEDCLSANPNQKAQAKLQSLNTKALSMEPQLNRRSHPPNFELVRSGLGLIFQMEKAIADTCGAPSVPDRAWLLIGLKHNGALQ